MLGDRHPLEDLFHQTDHAVVEKVKAEPRCRVCHVNRSRFRVLSEGWLAGKTIDPRGAVALCHHCLEKMELGDLDLWPELEQDEIVFAVRAHGGQEQARRALYPSDYDRNMERARRAA